MEKKDILILRKDGGKFYKALWNDAYILNYLFGYKILEDKKVGFPDNALDKVLKKLQECKISYQIVYEEKNSTLKKYPKNTYLEYLKYAKEKLDKSTKINKLIDSLEKMSDEDFEKLIEVIDEYIDKQ